MEVLLEEVRGDVKRIAEGHAVLKQEITETRQKLASRIDQLERQTTFGFKEVFQQLGKLTERFDAHERAHAT